MAIKSVKELDLTSKGLILFDGECNLCNGAVDFVMLRERKDYFLFASLQSELGQDALKNYEVDPEKTDSIILVEADKAFVRSTAALKIARRLKALWPVFYIFIIIPPFIRDAIYNWIAKNRYKWFGKRDTCRFPSDEERAKLLA